MVGIQDATGPRPCLPPWLHILPWQIKFHKDGYTNISRPTYTSNDVTMTFVHQEVGSVLPSFQYGPILGICF